MSSLQIIWATKSQKKQKTEIKLNIQSGFIEKYH